MVVLVSFVASLANCQACLCICCDDVRLLPNQLLPKHCNEAGVTPHWATPTLCYPHTILPPHAGLPQHIEITPHWATHRLGYSHASLLCGHNLGDFLQDFKLNVMRWHLLPCLGKLLFDMAQLLSAADYKEHYRRDLGPAALQPLGQGAPLTSLLQS